MLASASWRWASFSVRALVEAGFPVEGTAGDGPLIPHE